MTTKSNFLDTRLAWPVLTAGLRKTVILNLILGGAYFAVGVGALKLAFVGERVVVFWPPAGMAFAALWLLGPRAIPGVYLGSLAVDVVILQVWPPSLVGAFGNLITPMITTFVLRRLLRERAGLREFSRVLAFIVVGVVFGATISASIGCFALTVIGHERSPVAPMWGSWFMGDSIGVLMVAPAILLWRRLADVVAAWRTAVEPVLLALVAAAVMVAFTFIREASWTVELYKLFTFVLILSAAARYGLIGAAIGSLLADVVALSRGRAVAKGLTLDLTGLEHLPSLVMGDRVRCEQIFGNLVDNAIAYTQVGGVCDHSGVASRRRRAAGR